MTSLLHWRGRRRCVLFLDQFEFLLELIHSHVIHLSQLVELTQCEAGFSQITFLRLTVVLRQVLIRTGFFVKKSVAALTVALIARSENFIRLNIQTLAANKFLFKAYDNFITYLTGSYPHR